MKAVRNIVVGALCASLVSIAAFASAKDHDDHHRDRDNYRRDDHRNDRHWVKIDRDGWRSRMERQREEERRERRREEERRERERREWARRHHDRDRW